MNLKQRTYRLFSVISLCLAAVLGLNPSANADILRVKASAPSCPGDGITWGTAYKYLQDALDAASQPGSPITEIWVAAGQYYVDQSCANEDGSGLRTETFQLVKGVFLLAGFNGTESFASERDPVFNITILSGIVADEEPAPPCGSPGAGSCFEPHPGPGCDDTTCCQAVCAVDPSCCLIGFDWDDANCVSIALEECGEAFHVVTAGSEIDDPENTVIDGFTIRDGWATDTGFLQDQGGGMLIRGEPSVVRCTITQNTASYRGGGMSIRGIQPWIINCIFKDNPGDPANPGDQQVIPENGGGLASFLQVDPILTNCLFVGNAATGHGGGIFTGAGTCAQGECGEITLINCTLVANAADANQSGFGSGGGLYAGGNGSIVTVDNCIFWFNGAGQIEGVGATVFNVNYSDCQGGCPGEGTENIDIDPLFQDVPGDLRLTINSLCIDAGNPVESILPCDFFDLDTDGFACAPPDEPTPDLDLINRVLDGDDDDMAFVDMGSYEFIHPDICPWDLNGDCMVGVPDLLILLAAWGPNPGHPADFDGNGDVGVNDLLILLANWGPCQCNPGAEVLSLPEELADACLSDENWDEFEDVMMDPNASQEDKDRYLCWMEHYLFHCNKCTCTHRDHCPDPDPYSG